MFTDVLKGQKNKPSPRVAKTLEYFQALYQVEALAKGKLTRGGYTHRLRQQHSVPLLNSFKAWLDELAPKVLPESLLGKAISYSRNQWPYLSRYAMYGHAPLDNNVIHAVNGMNDVMPTPGYAASPESRTHSRAMRRLRSPGCRYYQRCSRKTSKGSGGL